MSASVGRSVIRSDATAASRPDRLDYEGPGWGRLGPDLDRAVERLERVRKPRRVVDVQLEHWLARLDRIAGLGHADDACGGAHRVLLARPSRAQPPRAHTHREGIEASHIARVRRPH